MGAMAAGLVQSYIILRILSVGEWGTVRTAWALGSSLGIYQHLGLAGASTREISVAKSHKEVFKIFFASILIRYSISIPLAIGLFSLAHFLSEKYNNPDIEILIKIYAFALFIQGAQGLLNPVISGLKRFKSLFTYQVGIALVSVVIYIPLVWFYRSAGFFLSFLLLNIISSLTLAYIAFKPLKDWFEIPSKDELIHLFKRLFSVSMAVFFVKVLYTNWENIGPNLLGLNNSAETVGIFGFAMLYAKKILTLSDSVTDVNLPVFSDKYATDRENFMSYFKSNFNKIFFFLLPIAFAASFWSREVIKVSQLWDKYSAANDIIMPIIFAFVFYSFLDIIKSSVFVPAKMIIEMSLSFIIMLAGTIIFYFGLKQITSPLLAMTYAMLAGSIFSLIFAVTACKQKMGVWILDAKHYALIIQSIIICLNARVENLMLKFVAFAILVVFYLIAAQMLKLVDVKMLWQKYLKKL